MPDTRIDVFFSYSSKDEALALSLIGLLKAAGVEVWIDKREIEVSESWAAEIAKAIEEAQAFLLFGTPDAFSSPQVTREVLLAVDFKKLIVPLIKGAVEIPPDFQYALAGLQRLDIGRMSLEESASRIVLALQSRGLSRLDPERGPQPISSPEILASEHETWLSTGGEQGARAEAHGADLSGAGFSRRKLARAIFGRCDLSGADFSGADLSRATFHGCSLSGASFHGAILRGARLLECTGLAERQLAEADLEGAELPGQLGFPRLERMAGTSRKALSLLLLVLTLCIACAAAIASTSDVSLMTGQVPFAGDLSLAARGVFVTLPGAVLAIWLFLQLTLQQFREDFAGLPAIFPDGEARHRKADFWLFGSYVQSRSKVLSAVDRLELILFYLLTWGCAPAAAFACWAFYLRRHDRSGLQLLAVMITLSAMAAALFLTRARMTSARWTGRWGPLLAGSALFPILHFLSYAAVDGMPVDGRPFLRRLDSPIGRLGQDILSQLGIPTSLDVSETRLSRSQKHLGDIDIKHVYALKLDAPALDLRGAMAVGASLREADLRGAHLEFAKLGLAYLSDAKMQGAWLQETHMEVVSATDIHFNGAHLEGAHCEEASMPGADFSDAYLSHADFRGADLSHAILRGADVNRADFYKADLRGADFTGAKNLETVCLSGANIFGAKGLDSVLFKFKNISEEDDDEYRRRLATGNWDSDDCGLARPPWLLPPPPSGWQADGLPSVGRYSGVEPRSLRHDDFEFPEPLPRDFGRDISKFLKGVQESDTQDAGKLFEEIRQRLGFERSEHREILAAHRSSDSDLVFLNALSITCLTGNNGVWLRLQPGFLTRRMDVEAFVSSELKLTREDLGAENRWKLSKGGYIAENAEDGVVYLTCERRIEPVTP